ncbi:dolichol kinase-like protein [Dinothrombium tinctorium]|uniref:dolichol kinase n=1 Tax=Dinothrombium tinctorium TaxID=1965070 RepID=A0A3S3S8M8_9ACAR|nr:dolichol kinase-like protein [Dinothrombium tinctorium]
MSGKGTTTKRKFFHLFIDLIFVLGLKQDIELLYFASSSFLYIFLVFEIIRVLKLPPLGKYIQDSFDTFRDEKDVGALTVSHIYLLVGVCLPLWIFPDLTHPEKMFLASGLISTGFGDTAASFFGSHFGRHKWPKSLKSYEGTLAAFLSQIFGSLFLLLYLDLKISANRVFALSISSFSTSIVEALTKQIDNLIIPLYFNLFLIVAFNLIK